MAEANEVTIDLSNIKLRNRDLIDFERYAGMTVNAAFGGKDPDPPYVAAVAMMYVLARQANPDMTWDDALDATYDDAELAAVGQAAMNLLSADPTPPANKAGKTTSKA